MITEVLDEMTKMKVMLADHEARLNILAPKEVIPPPPPATPEEERAAAEKVRKAELQAKIDELAAESKVLSDEMMAPAPDVPADVIPADEPAPAYVGFGEPHPETPHEAQPV